jgi:hypothetical protein
MWALASEIDRQSISRSTTFTFVEGLISVDGPDLDRRAGKSRLRVGFVRHPVTTGRADVTAPLAPRLSDARPLDPAPRPHQVRSYHGKRTSVDPGL